MHYGCVTVLKCEWYVHGDGELAIFSVELLDYRLQYVLFPERVGCRGAELRSVRELSEQ